MMHLRAAVVLGIWVQCSALQTAPLSATPQLRGRLPAMLAARRDAGAVADSTASIVRIGRSRALEERHHWARQDQWLPRDRSEVLLPIDDESLYQALRALSNRSEFAPSRPLSKRQVGATQKTLLFKHLPKAGGTAVLAMLPAQSRAFSTFAARRSRRRPT